MDIKELKEKSADELKETVAELRKELFDLEFKHGTRQLSDTASVGRTKKDIARALTLLRAKELEAQKAAAAG